MILKSNDILAKVNLSFDEFQNTFDPVMLYEALVDLCQMAGRGLQYCPGITGLIGSDETDLETISVDGLTLGTTIAIQYQGSFLVYTLTANDLSSVAPYIIRVSRAPGDSPRSWILSGAVYSTFTTEDLDEEYILTVQHNLGFPYYHVMIFDESNNYIPDISYAPDPENPATHCLVNIGSSFEGTRKILITY